MVVSGYLGTDCFFITTGLHLTGQLAVLKCKVKNILNDADGPRKAIRKIILGHHRLIRLADLLEDSFNLIIGQHLFGTTILLCISSYRMLSSLATTETGGIMTYVVYAFLLMWKLLIYCYVGESLLTEVIDFSNTLKAMTFSKRLLCLSGIWPLEIRDSLFISFILYGLVFNILALLDIIKYIKNFGYILANVMEYMKLLAKLGLELHSIHQQHTSTSSSF
ncbi:hypothetical protein HZH66_015456 [Vespula vulgaris]|uniref:Uncharacterized protein n=1 Tax=Vespula vulgaris TaxID=7454 RepID=A0A834IXP0_VESVU|nr:hypothetical protein HZH66_015456 [Vespula vulgaris]